MDKIIWKPVIIKDVKPIYEVSNYGDIRNIKTGKLRKPSKDKEGYLNINLSAISKKYKGFGVHRIVAKTFIPNPNNLETVNHINYDKTDNRVCNLNWMSNYDNIQDAKIHGRFLHRKGEDAPNSKYTELQINSVCKLLEEGFQNKDISKITGVPKNIIGFIKNGSIWTHISKNYSIPKPKEKCKYKKWFKVFDKFIIQGKEWKYVKNLYHISGKDTKSLRQLYKRREKKILQSSTTIQMEP